MRSYALIIFLLPLLKGTIVRVLHIYTRSIIREYQQLLFKMEAYTEYLCDELLHVFSVHTPLYVITSIQTGSIHVSLIGIGSRTS